MGLMAFEMKARCPYCLALHGIGAVTAITIFAYVASARVRGLRKSPVSSEHVVLSLSLGVICLAGLVGGQLLIEREFQTHRLIRVPYASVLSPVEPRLYDSIVQDEEHPFHGQRVIQLSLSRAWFNTSDVPLIGPRNARHVAVLFFDYTCSACRRLHGFMHQALDRYGDQLAFILAPVPMGGCGADAAEGGAHDGHEEAGDRCVYARLAMAVGRLAPERLGEFDRWLVHGGRLRPIEEAVNAAIRLVGRERLRDALDAPWIGERLAGYKRAFKDLPKEVGQSRVPVLAMNMHYLAGAPQTDSQLFGVLETTLQLQP
jgi:hypothetical protein